MAPALQVQAAGGRELLACTALPEHGLAQISQRELEVFGMGSL